MGGDGALGSLRARTPGNPPGPQPLWVWVADITMFSTGQFSSAAICFDAACQIASERPPWSAPMSAARDEPLSSTIARTYNLSWSYLPDGGFCLSDGGVMSTRDAPTRR